MYFLADFSRSTRAIYARRVNTARKIRVPREYMRSRIKACIASLRSLFNDDSRRWLSIRGSKGL